jgi:hypothetical protein
MRYMEGVGRMLSSIESICDHLKLNFSKGHTRIFGNISVGKRTRKLNHTMWDALSKYVMYKCGCR